jgi:protein-L-isoaspartate(D-aspartate) O-methyltransferase
LPGIERCAARPALLAVATTVAFVTSAATRDSYDLARDRMVREIQADVETTSREIGKKALDARVMEALARVPRHEFVPEELRDHAYDNRPLPIGYGQTISQPYIVALMTDLLGCGRADTVLEVGTGSGYQAAILAEFVKEVFTIEIIPQLAEHARARLERLGYANVEVRAADGYYGWEEKAPFDAIVVTAASSHVPQPLLRQLRPGGRMVIPLGVPFMVQQLMFVEKTLKGAIKTRQVLPVLFVPLTGGH